MSRFAVGDLHGHLVPLERLLAEVGFQRGHDELWLMGDIINKGPDDLAVVNFVRQLPLAQSLLGNHELHMLAVARGVTTPRPNDTFMPLLKSPDAARILSWFEQLPVLWIDSERREVMTHAGIVHTWSVAEAVDHADELQSVIRDPKLAQRYFSTIYGNTPERWSDHLTGPERWRVQTNIFTRMRFVAADGTLNLTHKTSPTEAPDGFKPWFEWVDEPGWQRLFGHWASLRGETHRTDCIGLDTGYCWGGELSLMDLDRQIRYQIDQAQNIRAIYL
jgi:bis(5'-nucleosyl)-tetraphosphatase (symmetrical)